ncbi:hypothetical protein GGS21DRAFT_504670 [Xylaria nigripes]|nr:hypothetical protein GGS21DRAFT_504670 [Xylaria nigripes]
MDQFVGLLLAFPPQNDNLNTEHEVYHRLASYHVLQLDKLLKERPKDLVLYSLELFNVVDPAVHSLSYLTILHALLFPSLASSVPHDLILEKVVTFMMTFDGRQCRYAGSLLLELMEAVGGGRLLPPPVAVETLATAILKLDPSGNLFTSSHLPLAKLAYETDNISLALPVIDKSIVFYAGMAQNDVAQVLCDPTLQPYLYISKNTGLTTSLRHSAVLEYDLLCGMIYCAMRDWVKARAAFERVVTFPTKADGCSKIMVDAFKRWVLLSLLAEGCHYPTPPYTTTLTARTFEILSKPYLALATTFATDDVQLLKIEADKNAQLWIDDGNVGLIREVMASYQKWRVLSMQHIYTKISIPEIRQQTKDAGTGEVLEKDEDMEMLILSMISSGMLKGVIEKNDDGTKCLVFLSSTTPLSEQQFEKEIQSTATQIGKLSDIYHATHQRLGTSKEYIKWVMRESTRDGNSRRDWTDDATLGFDSKVDDEDLMGGLSTI